MFPRHSLSRTASGNVAITHHSLERHRLPRAQVIYYGIERIQETRTSLETHDSIDERTRFAFVGRLVPEKGLDVLLRAAELLKNEGCRFELLLIGDGSERAKLEALIETKNLKNVARITGFLRGADLANQMNRVHAVVMPSVWEETAGLAAIEQMMRGRIVIASDIGGLGEIVDGAALKCPAGDPQRLADQMKKVIQGAPQVSELGKMAQDRARSMFSADRMVSEHVSAYLKMG
jgi:glycosyltransferase involved in cell wall biosynthesis